MTENTKNEAADRWLEYLQAIQSLSAEMNAAISALAGNDLERFESSVAEQERLCETVRGLSRLLRRSSHVGTSHKQLAAGRELRQQNRMYAAVLTRAAQICAALLSLYQDSSRGYTQDGRIIPDTHNWSCEV